jgi:hypothetical protein
VRVEGENALLMSFFLTRLSFPIVDDLKRIVDVFHVAMFVDPIDECLIPGDSKLK